MSAWGKIKRGFKKFVQVITPPPIKIATEFGGKLLGASGSPKAEAMDAEERQQIEEAKKFNEHLEKETAAIRAETEELHGFISGLDAETKEIERQNEQFFGQAAQLDKENADFVATHVNGGTSGGTQGGYGSSGSHTSGGQAEFASPFASSTPPVASGTGPVGKDYSLPASPYYGASSLGDGSPRAKGGGHGGTDHDTAGFFAQYGLRLDTLKM
jgi:hypothetical protein